MSKLDAYVRQVNPRQTCVMELGAPGGKGGAPQWGGPGSRLAEEAGEAWGPLAACRNTLKYVSYNSNVAGDYIKAATAAAGPVYRLPCITSDAPDAFMRCAEACRAESFSAF